MEVASGTPEGLEAELGELLDQELFEPSEKFRDSALITDESLHAEAARDPEAWWLKLAAELDWATEPTQALDDSNPPFYKWFADGKLNASYNCLDRHVEAGIGDRVAFYWRGEEGKEAEVTYADLHRDVQRLANVLLERGVEAGDVVGIYLPMIPEVAVAMLACARIGAPHNVVFGGFSPDAVKDRMQFSEAKALITVDAARRKGKTAEIKPAVDAFLERGAFDRDRDRGPQHRCRGGDDRGPRRLLRRGARGRGPGVPAGRARRRASALHPLQLGVDGEAEGDPAHHWRLSDRGRVDAQIRLRPQARRRRLLVLGRRRLGHGPLLHRLRAAPQRRHLGDVRGRARLPRQGHLVGAVRPLRGDDLLHGADRDPRLHEVGRRVPRAPRPLGDPPPGHGRRADQPEGMALVLEGDRRRARAGGRHLVADRDRAHHDHHPAGGAAVEAGLGGQAAARDRGGGARRGGQRRRRRAGPAGAAPAVAGDAADALPRRRPLRRDLLLQVRARDLLRRRRLAQGLRRLLLGDRPGRRRDQRLRPPPLDRRGRVGGRLATRRSPSAR